MSQDVNRTRSGQTVLQGTDTSGRVGLRWTQYLHNCVSGLLSWGAHTVGAADGLTLFSLHDYSVTGPHLFAYQEISVDELTNVYFASANAQSGDAGRVAGAAALRRRISSDLEDNANGIVLAIIVGSRPGTSVAAQVLAEAVIAAALGHNVTVLDVVKVPNLTADATWASVTRPEFSGVVASADAIEARVVRAFYGLPRLDTNVTIQRSARWLPERFRATDVAVVQREDAIYRGFVSSLTASQYDEMLERARELLPVVLCAMHPNADFRVAEANIFLLLLGMEGSHTELFTDCVRVMLSSNTTLTAALDLLLAQLVAATDTASPGPALLAALSAYLRGDGLTAAALLQIAAQDSDNTWASIVYNSVLHGVSPTEFHQRLAAAVTS